MNMKTGVWAGAALSLLLAGAVQASSITGDPEIDGFDFGGNSLASGVYVRGNANYAFDVYSLGFILDEGSNLLVGDGAQAWLAGDKVVAVGGKFRAIDQIAAGWDGDDFPDAEQINALLPTLDRSTNLKLQVKFGTADATWTTSTVAPGNGNGAGSLSQGGGGVQIRSSGYFTPAQWAEGSGAVNELASSGHITWQGVGAGSEPIGQAARIMWLYDEDAGRVASWELLLNTSLLDRMLPGHNGSALGDQAVLTVQNGDNRYTDAWAGIAPVPVPAAIWLLGSALGVIGLLRRRQLGWLPAGRM